jgi:hypothetical protein
MGLFSTLSPHGAPIFVADLPNARSRTAHRHHELVSNDEELQRFIADRDKDGRALYRTCATLKKPWHCKENVEASSWLWAEVDFKDHPALDREEILRRVQAVPYRPTLIVASGHGLHIYWGLNEPVDAAPGNGQAEFERALRMACVYVSGDPSATEASRLLRIPGTHNTKNGESAKVKIIEENANSYEVSDLVDFWETARPILPPAVRDKKRDDYGTTRNGSYGYKGPVDVDLRLSEMRYMGVGDTAIHPTLLSVTGSLLANGHPYEDVVARALGALKEAVAGDDRVVGWDWQEEEWDIQGMSLSFICKFVHERPQLADVLPDKWRDEFKSALAAGKIPTSGCNLAGTFLRYRDPAANGEDKNPGAATTRVARAKNNPALFVLPQTMPISDYAELKGLPWIYGNHYMRRTVSGTVAPGGTGKSSLSVGEAIVMAYALRNILGEGATERLRVWYHSGEEPMEILRLRIAAFCLHHGISESEIFPEWLVLTTKKEFPFRVAEGYSEIRVNDPLLARMAQQIKERGIVVAIFDPLVKMHRISEQDPGKMDQVASAFQELAEECNIGIDLVHHTRKKPAGNGDSDYTADDVRGAGALKDALRSVRILNQLTDKELATIPEHERKRYFRVSLVKANYSLIDRDTTYQLVTAQIPNEQLTEMGVVTLWTPPAIGSPELLESERKAEEVFMAILNRVTLQGTPRVSDRKGVNYAPRIFAAEPEALATGVGEKMLTLAMNRLIRGRRVKAIDEGSGGKAAHRIIPGSTT